jgi:hypothetical protein
MQIGFSPVTRNGTTLFCREDVATGTRFAKKQCLTPQDVSVMVEHEQQQKDLLRANCGGQGCGGPRSQ